jgi:hypothetical protein
VKPQPIHLSAGIFPGQILALGSGCTPKEARELHAGGLIGAIGLRALAPQIGISTSRETTMIRREMLGSLGAGMGLMALGATANAAAAAQAGDHAHREHDKVHAECLKACGECAMTCNETFHHCAGLVSSGKAEHYKSMILSGDCATFCGHSASMISKHSPLMAHSCMACAEACKDTLAEVGKFDSDEMKTAAKSLKACEDSCRAMVAAMKSGHQHHEPGKGKAKAG